MNNLIKKIAKKAATIALASAVMFSGFAMFNTADAARKGYDPKKVGGKFVYTTFSDATRLTAYTTNDSVSNRVQTFLYDGMLDQNDKLEPIPAVASSWKVSPDGMVYTFNLRKDVKFHDGKPLTADDVLFSYQMYMDPKSINPYKSSFSDIDKVEKVDNYTVKITLNKKNVLWLSGSAPYANILPKHQFPKGVEDFNSNNKIHRNPIGSGPFKFKEWRTAERIVLVANKDYFDGRPYFDEVIMRIVPSSDTEIIQLLKGDVDFVESIAAKKKTEVEKNKNLSVKPRDAARYDFIGFNIEKPQFSEKAVRQALAYGLNRQSLVDKVLLKAGKLASSNFLYNSPYQDKNVKPYPYDVKKANALLDAAGWKMGKDGVREKNGVRLEFEIVYNNGNKTREDISKIAQSDWKKIGVKAIPRSMDFSIELEKMDRGELDSWILAWNLGTDPNKKGLWHSGDIPTEANGWSGNNSSRVNNKKLDELMEKFPLEPDYNKRVAIYNEVSKIVSEEQYNLFMYHPTVYTAHNKRINGVKVTPYTAFYDFVNWYRTK